MNPSNQYYPRDLSEALLESASSVFALEQLAAKSKKFYELLENNSTAIDHPLALDAGNTPLLKSFVNRKSTYGPELDGATIDYLWQGLNWRISKPYDAYRHELSGLITVSSWLQCLHPEGSRYDVLLQTVRSQSTHPTSPLTISEVQNSISVIVSLRREDASFKAFYTYMFSNNEYSHMSMLDSLSPAENELLLNHELDSMLIDFTSLSE